MKINTRLDDYAAALRKSELDYFRAAAETRQLLHGELCYQSGFEKIASSCVLHNVSSLRCKMRPEVWLEQLLEEFVSIGAHCCRFYLTGAQSLDNSFIDNGLFKKVVEIGMLTDFSGVDPFDAVIPGQLLPIDNHKTLDLKRDLYRESALGPDGHDMHGGFFADFEHAKCRAGYMDSFLFIDDGQVKGAVLSLIHI